jgi:iron complex transport system ATP-binding protein
MKVLDVLKSLSDGGMGIIMSSHSPDHAFYCGDTTVMITKDKRVLFGDNDQILNQKNLNEVYGVNIEIISKELANGEMLKTCCLL